MPGPGHHARGPRPKIENPGKLFKRLMGYVLKNYTPHVIIVVICIFVGVFANIQGTLFTQTLIDAVDGLLPSADEAEELEEERRLFYVGATRARKQLEFLCYENKLN